MPREQQLEVGPVDAQGPRLLQGLGRSAAGVTVEQRELAEEVARLHRFEHDALAGGVFDEHLDLTRRDDEDGSTGV